MGMDCSKGWLCEAIGAGNAQAEQIYYVEYRSMAIAEAYRWLKNADDAEDIAQEAMLRVLCRLRNDGLAEPEKLEGFLRRTVKFVALGHLRSHGVARTTSMETLPEVSEQAVDGFVSVARLEIDNQVACLIKKLSRERDRQLIQRHYIDDCSKELLCDQLDLKPDQFDRVVHRARRRLRNVVESCAPELAEECYC